VGEESRVVPHGFDGCRGGRTRDAETSLVVGGKVMAEVRPTDQELAERLLAARVAVPANSGWRHVKTGHIYLIRSVALEESDPGVVLVVYYRDGSPFDEVIMWARPLSEFTDGRYTREW
jgi:hypothetical protein